METLNNNQQTTGLKIFNNSEIGARIRATTERNETWFVAQDIFAEMVDKIWDIAGAKRLVKEIEK